MKKFLLLSLAFAASASMMAQVSTKLAEFKMDNLDLKESVSGVAIPKFGNPTLIDGPVAGSKAIHFDGSSWYNLDDCTKIPGTQLGKKEFAVVTWFRFSETVAAQAKEGSFIQVGATATNKFFQCELQGSNPPAATLTFFGRFASGGGGKMQASNSLVDGEADNIHYICDGEWHLMVAVKSNAAAGPNWYFTIDGVTSDGNDGDETGLSTEKKNESWDDALGKYKEIRLPFQSKQNVTKAGVIDAELNYTGNLSIGNNVKDTNGSNANKELKGDLYSITIYEGVPTTDQIRGWYNEVYPGFYQVGGTGGIEDVTVAPVEDADAPAYNLMGQPVDDSYKGIVVKGGKKYLQK